MHVYLSNILNAGLVTVYVCRIIPEYFFHHCMIPVSFKWEKMSQRRSYIYVI